MLPILLLIALVLLAIIIIYRKRSPRLIELFGDHYFYRRKPYRKLDNSDKIVYLTIDNLKKKILTKTIYNIEKDPTRSYLILTSEDNPTQDKIHLYSHNYPRFNSRGKCFTTIFCSEADFEYVIDSTLDSLI